MAKYREIPTEVEAKQFIGSNVRDILNLAGECVQFDYSEQGIQIFLETQDGKAQLEVKDWVVKYDDGRIKAVSADLFKILYEPINTEEQA